MAEKARITNEIVILIMLAWWDCEWLFSIFQKVLKVVIDLHVFKKWNVSNPNSFRTSTVIGSQDTQ